METVNRKERPREPGEGENPVSVNSMENHSGVAFPKNRGTDTMTEK